MAHQNRVVRKGGTMKAGEAVAVTPKKEQAKIAYAPRQIRSPLLQRKIREWKNAVLVSGIVKT